MKRVSKETMLRITEEFPTVRWSERDLEELVAPKYGLITGFHRFLEEVEAIANVDLGESGVAGVLRNEVTQK